MNRLLWVVHHQYGKNEFQEHKGIGIFTSRTKAMLAVRKLRSKPGFKRLPNNFIIAAVSLNEVFWRGGFRNNDRNSYFEKIKSKGKVSRVKNK